MMRALVVACVVAIGISVSSLRAPAAVVKLNLAPGHSIARIGRIEAVQLAFAEALNEKPAAGLEQTPFVIVTGFENDPQGRSRGAAVTFYLSRAIDAECYHMAVQAKFAREGASFFYGNDAVMQGPPARVRTLQGCT